MNTENEEIIREAHTILPVDLQGREQFLQYLEQALATKDAEKEKYLDHLSEIHHCNCNI